MARPGLSTLLLLALVACGEDAPMDECTLASDCADTERCVNGMCRPLGAPVPLSVVDAEGVALSDVDVVAVLPEGTRVELRTDASGQVDVPNVDFELGALSVGAYREGYTVGGALSLRADSPESLRTIVLHSLEPLELITVRGTITGLAAGDAVNVSANVPATVYQGLEPEYEILVEAGVPFYLFAQAFRGSADPPPRGVRQELFLGWASAASEGGTEDLILDLDLATEPPIVSSGSLLLPESGRLAENGAFSAFISDRGLTPFVGAASLGGISSGGTRAEYELAHIVPDELESLRTRFVLSDGTRTSWVVVEGAPPEGDQRLRFLAEVDITRPAFGETQGLFDRLEFTEQSDDVPLAVVWTRDGGVRGFIAIAPGATDAAMPAPPAEFPLEPIAGSGELDARIHHCARLDRNCPLSTTSRAFGLVP